MRRLPFGAFFGEPRGNVDLGGFTVGEFVDRPHDPIFRHTHEDAHFWFVLAGQYISSAAGLPEVCGPPTVIFVPAGTTHVDRFHTRGGSFMTLSIRPSLMERLGGHGALGGHAVGFTGGELPWLGRRLHHELHSSDAASPLVMEGLGLELLAHVARERQRRAPAEAWLRAAFELVNDSYRERLTVQGIASALGVPALQLGRAFRRAFGCSPGDMVRRRRVARAEELLRGGRLSLADIALASGFADQAQLTKAFRRVTGFTPGRYRRLFCSN